MAATVRRSWPAWLLLGLAVGLAVLALVVVAEDLGGRNRNATTFTTAVNLVTEVLSLVGGVGYFLNRRWGIPIFGLSLLDHVIGHGYLVLGAANSVRASLAAFVGLSIIPALAALGLMGMIWESRRAQTH